MLDFKKKLKNKWQGLLGLNEEMKWGKAAEDNNRRICKKNGKMYGIK
jgi:hypothetical protein